MTMHYCNLCERVKDGTSISMYGYDKLCPECRKQIEGGLSIDTEMKVYHWPSVVALESYGTGQVIVVADSLEHALKFLKDTSDTCLLPELETKMPIIYPIDVENFWLVAIEGSA